MMADWTVDYYEDYVDALPEKMRVPAKMNRASIHEMLEENGLGVLKLHKGGIHFYERKKNKEIVAERNAFEYLIMVNTRDGQKGSFTFKKATLII